MKDIGSVFGKYDNPIEARKLWEYYQDQIKDDNIHQIALDILHSCDSVFFLKNRLNELTNISAGLSEFLKRYDNPVRARRILMYYMSDIKDYHRYQDVLDVLRSCDSTDSLDVRLDRLFGKTLHFAGNHITSWWRDDEELDGSYSRLRRMFEEESGD